MDTNKVITNQQGVILELNKVLSLVDVCRGALVAEQVGDSVSHVLNDLSGDLIELIEDQKAWLKTLEENEGMKHEY
jgi:hypothetical protein